MTGVCNICGTEWYSSDGLCYLCRKGAETDRGREGLSTYFMSREEFEARYPKTTKFCKELPEMAKQIGPMAKREAIAAIIRACHRSQPQNVGSVSFRFGDSNSELHIGEYDAADRIMDLDADDHK